MNGITVKQISNLDDFISLKEAWNQLLNRSSDNNIYLTHEWLSTWWKHNGAGKKLSIFLIKHNSIIIGIFPLMSCSYGFGPISINILENIGSTFPDYSGAILAEMQEEAITAFLNHLRKTKMEGNRAVIISQIPHDNQLIRLLEKQLSCNSIIYQKKLITTCPFLNLPSSCKELCGSIRQKRKKNLRYSLRLLKNSHLLKYRESNMKDNLYNDLELFFKLSNKRWNNMEDQHSQSEKRAKAFYLDLANEFRKNGWLNLSFLYADDSLISAVIGFNYNNIYYYSNQTYNPDYSKFSPGSIHLLFLLKRSIGNEMKEFDFLKGEEAYKLMWTQSKRDNFQVKLSTDKIFGQFICYLIPFIMRLSEISHRGFFQNYHLYLEKKKQENTRKRLGI